MAVIRRSLVTKASLHGGGAGQVDGIGERQRAAATEQRRLDRDVGVQRHDLDAFERGQLVGQPAQPTAAMDPGLIVGLALAALVVLFVGGALAWRRFGSA
jgi:hypothetical protein